MPDENLENVPGIGAPNEYYTKPHTDTTPLVVLGDTIQASTFRDMLTILEGLQNHNHIFYDDYTTVCECQCQCQCGRGTV